MALAFAAPADARVTKIVVDRVAPLAGDATYETVTGRAFGELDPLDPHNGEITDLNLAPKNAKKAQKDEVRSKNRRVEFVTLPEIAGEVAPSSAAPTP